MTRDADKATDWLAARAGALPVVEWSVREGHEPRGLYVEQFWLPVIGPSALLAWWRMLSIVDMGAMSGTTIDCVDLAWQLGLGRSAGKNAPITRTLARLCRYEFATIDHECYAVRTLAPKLSRTLVARNRDRREGRML